MAATGTAAANPPDYIADPDAESPENLVAKFQILAAEGDLLAQRGAWGPAIEAYSKALNIRPIDKHCLVARSRCHINAGNGKPALDDAEEALKEDPEFFKGIYQKAEALYAIGDFETALVFYHRGNRLRPELDEFRTGIQKAREAIENGIGNPRENKIHVPQTLRKQLAAAAAVEAEAASDPSTRKANAGKDATGRGGRIAFVQPQQQEQKATSLSPALENKLLGELYEDKVYLEGLLSDKDFTDCPDEQVISLVTDGIRYLQTRIDFWRQQNPLYARPKEKRIKPRMERGGLKPRTHTAEDSGGAKMGPKKGKPGSTDGIGRRGDGKGPGAGAKQVEVS